MLQREPISALRAGELVVMLDERAPEVGAELWLAAEGADAAQFARLVRHTTGFVSVALPASRATALQLPAMAFSMESLAARHPVQAVTCDAAEGVSTGISATDRARTARLLADPASGPDDFQRPGHLVPLRVREGTGDPGMGTHAAHAALELAAMAGLSPAMIRCELLDEKGALVSAADGLQFARRHRLATVARHELVSASMARIA